MTWGASSGLIERSGGLLTTSWLGSSRYRTSGVFRLRDTRDEVLANFIIPHDALTALSKGKLNFQLTLELSQTMEKGTDPRETAADASRPVVVEPVGDKDVAIAMVGEQGHAVDPLVVQRAVRKIDWFLIPAMTVGCEFRYPLPRAEYRRYLRLTIISRWTCIL